MFALEWLQRFKDSDRGAKFFDARSRRRRRNGASPMKSVVAAFTLLRQVHGEQGEWAQLLDLADAVIDRIADRRGASCSSRSRPVTSRSTRSNDIARAKKYFAIAARIEPQNPNVAGVRRSSSAPTRCRWPRARCRRSRLPTRRAADAVAPQPKAAAERDARPSKAAAAKRKPPRDRALRAEMPLPKAERSLRSEGRGRRRQRSCRCRRRLAADKACCGAKRCGREGRRREGRRRGCGRARRSRRARWTKAKSAEGGPTRASASGRRSSRRIRRDRAPRRELARVLRTAQSWAQLADALKDEEAKACADAGPRRPRCSSSSPMRTASSTTTTRSSRR